VLSQPKTPTLDYWDAITLEGSGQLGPDIPALIALWVAQQQISALPSASPGPTSIASSRPWIIGAAVGGSIGALLLCCLLILLCICCARCCCGARRSKEDSKPRGAQSQVRAWPLLHSRLLFWHCGLLQPSRAFLLLLQPVAAAQGAAWSQRPSPAASDNASGFGRSSASANGAAADRLYENLVAGVGGASRMSPRYASAHAAGVSPVQRDSAASSRNLTYDASYSVVASPAFAATRPKAAAAPPNARIAAVHSPVSVPPQFASGNASTSREPLRNGDFAHTKAQPVSPRAAAAAAAAAAVARNLRHIPPHERSRRALAVERAVLLQADSVDESGGASIQAPAARVDASDISLARGLGRAPRLELSAQTPRVLGPI
jgi:hypothetical protein